jgi:hypothetical protein
MRIAFFGNFFAQDCFSVFCQSNRTILGGGFDVENVGQNGYWVLGIG